MTHEEAQLGKCLWVCRLLPALSAVHRHSPTYSRISPDVWSGNLSNTRPKDVQLLFLMIILYVDSNAVTTRFIREWEFIMLEYNTAERESYGTWRSTTRLMFMSVSFIASTITSTTPFVAIFANFTQMCGMVICPTCGRNVTNPRSFFHHVDGYGHKEWKKKHQRCPFCVSNFSRKDNRNRHIRQKHEENIAIWRKCYQLKSRSTTAASC